MVHGLLNRAMEALSVPNEGSVKVVGRRLRAVGGLCSRGGPRLLVSCPACGCAHPI